MKIEIYCGLPDFAHMARAEALAGVPHGDTGGWCSGASGQDGVAGAGRGNEGLVSSAGNRADVWFVFSEPEDAIAAVERLRAAGFTAHLVGHGIHAN